MRELWARNHSSDEKKLKSKWRPPSGQLLAIWCHASSLSGLGERLIDFISSAIHLCIHVEILLFQTSAQWQRRQMATRTWTPISCHCLYHTLHCSFNKFTIGCETDIRDWNRLPLFLFLSRFDWSSSSQGASIFKRRFVACRHSSIEQKHAHDGLMNNTLMMRETTPAGLRSLVSLNCSTSLFPTWRAPANFRKTKCVQRDERREKRWTEQRAENACGVLILLSVSLTIEHQSTGQSTRTNTNNMTLHYWYIRVCVRDLYYW